MVHVIEMCYTQAHESGRMENHHPLTCLVVKLIVRCACWISVNSECVCEQGAFDLITRIKVDIKHNQYIQIVKYVNIH